MYCFCRFWSLRNILNTRVSGQTRARVTKHSVSSDFQTPRMSVFGNRMKRCLSLMVGLKLPCALDDCRALLSNLNLLKFFLGVVDRFLSLDGSRWELNETIVPGPGLKLNSPEKNSANYMKISNIPRWYLVLKQLTSVLSSLKAVNVWCARWNYVNRFRQAIRDYCCLNAVS